MQFRCSVFFSEFELKRLLIVSPAVISEHFYAAVERKAFLALGKKRNVRVAFPILPEIRAFVRESGSIAGTVGIYARIVIKKIVGLRGKADNGQSVVLVDDITERYDFRRKFALFVRNGFQNGRFVERQRLADVFRALICRRGAIRRVIYLRVPERGKRDRHAFDVIVNTLRRVGKGCLRDLSDTRSVCRTGRRRTEVEKSVALR